MFKKERVSSLLDAAVKEMNLLLEMSKDINKPEDFVSSTSGMIVFRACGMSMEMSMQKVSSTPSKLTFQNSYRLVRLFVRIWKTENWIPFSRNSISLFSNVIDSLNIHYKSSI